MRPGLSLRVSQHLALTPQLQQSIRLLQLSTLELASEVEQMLDDNPFLERAEDDAVREDFGVSHADARVSEGDRVTEQNYDGAGSDTSDSGDAAEVVDVQSLVAEGWDGDGSVDTVPDDSEWGGDAPARLNNLEGDDELDAGQRGAPQESLAAHLHRQALSLRGSPEDVAAVRFIIESLNDDGYLEDSLAELAATLLDEHDDQDQMEELVHRLTLALKLVQSMEPAGVGARSLAECLTLQLKSRESERGVEPMELARIGVALKICAQHGAMELLARRDARRLVQLTGEAEELVRSAMAYIGRLEPKPGRRFADVTRNAIVPDVIVTSTGQGAQQRFRVQLNPDVMPRLRVHEIYANALRGGRGGDTHQALAQRLQEARWFIRNIQQRFDTILRVSQAIVERQKNFFVHGELAMRPMVQRELADELGVHESTISRVTTAKYMATPQGTFELKHFFGSALGTEAGGNASSTAVRALIKQFIVAEDPKKPLSDNQIAEMLKEQGIDCARRTVAKYREGLRIPVASLRKAQPV